MMQKTFFSGTFANFSPELHFISQFDSDVSLNFDRRKNDEFSPKKFPKNTFVAIRFTAGGGCLMTYQEEKTTFSEDVLYFVPLKNISKLSADAASSVNLYIFSVEKLLTPFQTEKLFSVRYSADEKAIADKLLSLDLEYDSLYRTMANHYFAIQFFNWKKQFEIKASFENEIYANEIKKAVAYIDENLYNKISFSHLSAELNLSERNFRKVFKDYLGVSPKTYMQERRLEIAAEKLRQGGETINEISDLLGYYSQYQFSRDFKKRFDVSPSQYKKFFNPRV